MNQPEMKRPRSPKDYPTLDSWFTPAFDSFAQGGENLLRLMRSLIGTTRYIEYWRQDRSYEENQAAAGVDPLIDLQAYLDFQRALGNKSDSLYGISAYAFSSKVFPSNPSKESLSLHYSGGIEQQGMNNLSIIPAQRERAKEVEIALAQMGVLPTHEYLLGRAE